MRTVGGEGGVLDNADGPQDGLGGQRTANLAEGEAVLEHQDGRLQTDAAKGTDRVQVQSNERCPGLASGLPLDRGFG